MVTKSTKTKKWNAWAGTRRDLRLLLESIDKAIEPAVKRLVEADQRWPAERLASAENDLVRATRELESVEQRVTEATEEYDSDDAGATVPPILAYMRKEVIESTKGVKAKRVQVTDAQQALEDAGTLATEKYSIGVRMYTPTGSVEHRGDVEMLAGKFDSRTLGSFVITGPDAYGSDEKIIVTVTRSELQLSVGGPEDWTTSTFASISEEISKSVAWWSRIRGIWGSMATVLATSILGATALHAVAPDSESGLILTIAIWLVVLTSGVWGQFIIRRIVPTFEVTDGGSKPKGAAALGVLGVLLLEIVVGVLINVYV
ncbi:hypothetical protein HQQ82_01170 [Rathayibacter sp. VKM Ac-2856]|uniref:hypothetical protein n=1 Tax=unclassified Rathayibacter TaxID=2609250 RepID=UPI00156572AC|nr:MULTISPECIES: hypothetical protein [unclassified Rathayibacter]NQX03406.1 hypothetical protein [Rathayibacter sp. VKM Ac-2858]NQX18574.1 hypothetical protein [Rathayibacter sp. VKM Ac-2856]